MKKFLNVDRGNAVRHLPQQAMTEALGKVMLSNRPDLCEYQCNGAMAGAKLYKKPPS